MLAPLTSAVNDTGLYYKKHMNSELSGITPIATSSSSAAFKCSKLCKDDSQCMTFSMSGNQCQLYDEDEFTTELVASSGKEVFTPQYVDTIAGPLFNLTRENGGAPNIFPAMAVTRRGTVAKWKVVDIIILCITIKCVTMFNA